LARRRKQKIGDGGGENLDEYEFIDEYIEFEPSVLVPRYPPPPPPFYQSKDWDGNKMWGLPPGAAFFQNVEETAIT
jgi:hypothetical protein